ncbi:MAG: iron-containing alcohol dehydrogenase [Alloprevotella sp.]|nr:iron-containing alcohol dehydrogenase [Alloprevotella sp.]
MQNFEYYSPTDFVFGRGVEARTGELVRRFGGNRVLLVYGGGHAVRSGLLPSVEDVLRQAGLDYVAFGGVLPNPTDEQVYAGIDKGRQADADFVLAVGGGSVIDAAKAMAAGIPYEGDFWDFYEGKETIGRALPVGVVLTIPAAGSEGSGNSVITQTATRRKVSIRTPYLLRPRLAVMNPELTYSLPAYQTAAGATDMMAHIMERYFTNTPHTEVPDAVGEAVMRTIRDVTPQAIANPTDYDARAALMWCGTLAHNGICGTGNEEDWASHGMEHELSAFYGVTHGAGLAVVFPAWLTYMAEHHPAKLVPWARNVWQADTPLEGIARFKAWLHSIGMPVTIAELGITGFDLEAVNAHVHVTKGSVFGNYLPLDAERTRAIYRLML